MMASLSFNPQYEKLLLSLNQIEALIEVIINVDVTGLEYIVISHYFLVLADFISVAKLACESLADLMIF